MPTDVHQKVAGVILREVPLSQISGVLKRLNPANVADEDKGHGCGLGCSHPSGFDQFGHSTLTATELKASLTDKAGLSAAIKSQVAKLRQDLDR